MKQKKPITRQNFGGCVLVPQSYDITQGPIEISVVHLSTHSIYTPFGFVCIRLDTCGVICYSQHIVAKINNLWIFGNLLCAGKERERERERESERPREREDDWDEINREGDRERENALARCREATREDGEARGQWWSGTLLISGRQVHGERMRYRWKRYGCI